jgi:histidine triad (HIT) family protein
MVFLLGCGHAQGRWATSYSGRTGAGSPAIVTLDETGRFYTDGMAASIYTRIIDGEIPGEFVHKDNLCVAIRDINPAAPVHILVIPREPVAGIGATRDEHAALLGHLLGVCRQVAAAEGLAERGYRIVINEGPDSGQTIDHLHLHVLGGRPFGWPPG